ncbi:hypothetical protein DVT68_03990 [Dyella solisilvae]|uniref:SHOCT domain-containing protein n=1 Tax=Dyella solisilvae TaxID=1920168 RepID=A0A370KBH0_9GAMM|nr:hypothetical protein [Dyella solisilvae]RDI99996.1 hypothetical protein DVT68_03990 [Dyella solisilvae]
MPLIVLLVLASFEGAAMNRTMISALLVLACLLLAGCGHPRPIEDSESCGKQMTDLQNAVESGAMTKKEFDHAHKALMKRCLAHGES